ncbi:MAG: RDD family protein [Pseudomonadota bacterium]
MDEHNPYHAPAAQIADALPQELLEIEPAGRWRRFFTLLIDYFCFTLLELVGWALYVASHYGQGAESMLAALEGLLEEPSRVRDYGIGLGVMLTYYIAMEGFFGFTVGKLITGTRVVTEDGGRPRWGQIVGRSFARLIPFEPLSVLFSNRKQRRGWHDSLPKTYVVRRY